MDTISTFEQILAAKDAKKVVDCTNEELLQILSHIFKAISVNKFPDQEASKIIIDSIRRNYSGYGVEELLIAFRLFIDGKLNLDLEHYQSFDFLYLRKIMDAYKQKYRGKAITSNNYKQLPEPMQKDNLQEGKEHFDWMIKYYEQNKKFIAGIKYGPVFDYLVDGGVISLSKEEKQQIKDKLVKKLKSKLKVAKYQTGDTYTISYCNLILNSEEMIRIECRKHYIQQWVKKNY